MKMEGLVEALTALHHAVHVPVAVYRGRARVFSIPEDAQTASTVLGNGDALQYLPVDDGQTGLVQHVRSSFREHFIYAPMSGYAVLLGPMTQGRMDETRLNRLFALLRPKLFTGALRRHLKSLPHVDAKTCHYLGKLLLCLLQGKSLSSQDLPLPKDLSPVVQSAVQFIHRHLDRRLTAGDIAQHAKVHPDYLSSLFKKEMGLAMMVYIQKQHVEEACALLTGTDLSLADIARQCQFSSPSRFADIFKKHMGMTPTEYKQISLND